MGAWLDKFRKDNPGDARIDADVLFELVRKKGEAWVKANYPEDYDEYDRHVWALNPLSATEEFSRGARRGWEGLKGTYYGAKGLAWKGLEKYAGTDTEDYAKQNLRWVLEHQQAAARPEVQGDPDSYAGWIGEAAPSLTEALVTGAAGAGAGLLAGQAGPQAATPEEIVTVPAGFIAGVFGKNSVKQLIRNEIVKKLGKEATEASVKSALKTQLAGATTKAQLYQLAASKGITTKALRDRISSNLMRYGGTATSIMNSEGMNTGEIFADLGNDPDIDLDQAFNTAMLYGTAAAIPDSVLPSYVTGKLVKAVTGQTLAKTAKKGLYGKIANSSYGKVASALTKWGGTGVFEGGTEFYQEYVGVLAGKTAKGMTLSEAIDDPLSYEELKGMKHAAKIGFTAGLMAGGGVTVADVATGKYSTPEDVEETPAAAPTPAKPAPTTPTPAPVPVSKAKIDDAEVAKVEELVARKVANTSFEGEKEIETDDSALALEVNAAVNGDGVDAAVRAHYYARLREELAKKKAGEAAVEPAVGPPADTSVDPETPTPDEPEPTFDPISGKWTSGRVTAPTRSETMGPLDLSKHSPQVVALIANFDEAFDAAALEPVKEFQPMSEASEQEMNLLELGRAAQDVGEKHTARTGWGEGQEDSQREKDTKAFGQVLKARNKRIKAANSKKSREVPALTKTQQQELINTGIDIEIKALVAEQNKIEEQIGKANEKNRKKLLSLQEQRADGKISKAEFDSKVAEHTPSKTITNQIERIKQKIDALTATKGRDVNEVFPSNDVAFQTQGLDKVTTYTEPDPDTGEVVTKDLEKPSYPAFYLVNEELEASRE
ncbi:hypothetical protein CMI37_17865, partial [Candidatus Pacearchaeota archaeon]|nr:hypothetical protein [Candidatus Pacearchaeota archaeon]